MTKIKDVKIKCHECGTEYEGAILLSYNSTMGKPDMPPLVCPKCGTAYKPGDDLPDNIQEKESPKQ